MAKKDSALRAMDVDILFYDAVMPRGLKSVMDEIEKALIEKALNEAAETGQDMAAMYLGVNRTTLLEMRRRHGLELRPRRPNNS